MSTFFQGRRFTPAVRRENLRIDRTDDQQAIQDGMDGEIVVTGDEPTTSNYHSESAANHSEAIPLLPPSGPLLEPDGLTARRLTLPPLRTVVEQNDINNERGNAIPASVQSTSSLRHAKSALKSPARSLAVYQLDVEQDVTATRKPWLAYRTALIVGLGCFIGGISVGQLQIPWTNHVERSKTNATDVRDQSDAKADILDPLDQDNLDEAYRDQKTGKFAEAAQIFAALHSKHPAWGSVGAAVGTTAMYQHEWSTAQITLRGLANEPRSAAESHFHLGILYTIRKDYDQAKVHFANAVALDPTRSDFYYFWGECLHQEGKQLEAASKFRSALLRNQFEASEGFYRLKLWLCEIQADQEDNDGTFTEIEAALSQVNPPMEAIFASAARKIKKGEFNAAANQLLRARELVSSKIYFVILQDPIFFQESWRPELAPAFKSEDWFPGLIDAD